MTQMMRYDMQIDEMVPVTQEWVDQMALLCRAFGAAREISRRIVENEKAGLVARRRHQEFLDAWSPELERTGSPTR